MSMWGVHLCTQALVGCSARAELGLWLCSPGSQQGPMTPGWH